MAENYEIIDAHAHIFPQKIAEKATTAIGDFYDIPMNNCGLPENLLEVGAEISVSKYLVCSTATVPQQAQAINNFIAEECEKHPEFFGFGTLHAEMDGLEEEAGRIAALGLRGIKLHPDFQKFDIDDPRAEKIYQAAKKHDFPVLIHMGDDRYDYSSPKRLAIMADKYPETRFIAAHFGGYRRWEEAGELLRKKNVWFDTSSSLPMISKEEALRLVDCYGADRLFWGTDFPMWSHKKELERFLALGLPEEINRMILSENAKKFFGL